MKQFSFKRVGEIISAIILIAGLGVGGYFFATSRFAKIAYAKWVLGNREHHLTCYELPFYPQVQKAFAEHADVVEKLKAAGALSINPVENKCSGFEGGLVFVKGDIEIEYSSHQQKVAIEKIIGDNFFGIPYRGYNR